MGSIDFQQYAEGANPAYAFATAVAEARHAHDHPDCGTIAGKQVYVVIAAIPLSEPDARALAQRLLDARDPRIRNTSGPAGAIAVRGGPATIAREIPRQPGGHRTPYDAAAAALDDPTRTILDFTPGPDYRTTAQGRPSRGTLVICVRGGHHHTGWLFFGFAAR